MSLLDRAVSGLAVLRELSAGWSCPVHCGASSLPFFLSGFCLGFLSAFLLLSLLAVWIFHHFQGFPASVPVDSPTVGAASTVVRRRSRLSAYLHE